MEELARMMGSALFEILASNRMLLEIEADRIAKETNVPPEKVIQEMRQRTAMLIEQIKRDHLPNS